MARNKYKKYKKYKSKCKSKYKSLVSKVVLEEFYKRYDMKQSKMNRWGTSGYFRMIESWFLSTFLEVPSFESVLVEALKVQDNTDMYGGGAALAIAACLPKNSIHRKSLILDRSVPVKVRKVLIDSLYVEDVPYREGVCREVLESYRDVDFDVDLKENALRYLSRDTPENFTLWRNIAFDKNNCDRFRVSAIELINRSNQYSGTCKVLATDRAQPLAVRLAAMYSFLFNDPEVLAMFQDPTEDVSVRVRASERIRWHPTLSTMVFDRTQPDVLRKSLLYYRQTCLPVLVSDKTESLEMRLVAMRFLETDSPIRWSTAHDNLEAPELREESIVYVRGAIAVSFFKEYDVPDTMRYKSIVAYLVGETSSRDEVGFRPLIDGPITRSRRRWYLYE